MIRHAATIDDGQTLAADLCIVGAGAAGITLALQFADSGLRVLLLEGGEEQKLPAAQSLYAGTVDTPDLHSPPDRYRERRLGGTTTVWSGRCLPYDPIDFERRSWIADSGWPISYEDVARHYPKAVALCEAGEPEFSAERVKPGGMRPLIRSFTTQNLDTDRVERFSCPTNFGDRYRHRLEASPNTDVILGANVTEILTAEDGSRVRGLTVRGLDGRRFTVSAHQVVLATGGLEIPRLLLASRDRHAAGLGNRSGLVGRFYMCHIAGTIGDLRLDVEPGDVNAGYEQADDGTYCRRRLALTAEAQAELNEGILIACMIETPEAVENAEAIAAVPGVDVLMFGTSDLTATMGIPGQIGHPDVRKAYEKVGAACAKHGKAMGMGGVYDEKVAPDYIRLGARFILSGNDHSFLLAGASQRAFSGLSDRNTSAMRPRITAGMASTMNSHCHPRSPRLPSSCSRAPDSGEPIKLDRGIETLNSATMRARYADGNQ